MKRVEESILSRDYKKHIQVGGKIAKASPSGLTREVQVLAIGKASPSSSSGHRPDAYLHRGLEETSVPCHQAGR